MNPWAAWAPALIAVFAAIFNAGQTSGRIKDQEKALKRHDDWLLEHDDKIGVLEVGAAEAKAWREGYNAGKATHTR